jgi:hypothetical protein
MAARAASPDYVSQHWAKWHLGSFYNVRTSTVPTQLLYSNISLGFQVLIPTIIMLHLHHYFTLTLYQDLTPPHTHTHTTPCSLFTRTQSCTVDGPALPSRTALIGSTQRWKSHPPAPPTASARRSGQRTASLVGDLFSSAEAVYDRGLVTRARVHVLIAVYARGLVGRARMQLSVGWLSAHGVADTRIGGWKSAHAVECWVAASTLCC